MSSALNTVFLASVFVSASIFFFIISKNLSRRDRELISCVRQNQMGSWPFRSSSFQARFGFRNFGSTLFYMIGFLHD